MSDEMNYTRIQPVKAKISIFWILIHCTPQVHFQALVYSLCLTIDLWMVS
jgi:hypothetical protein